MLQSHSRMQEILSGVIKGLSHVLIFPLEVCAPKCETHTLMKAGRFVLCAPTMPSIIFIIQSTCLGLITRVSSPGRWGPYWYTACNYTKV